MLCRGCTCCGQHPGMSGCCHRFLSTTSTTSPAMIVASGIPQKGMGCAPGHDRTAQPLTRSLARAPDPGARPAAAVNTLTPQVAGNPQSSSRSINAWKWLTTLAASALSRTNRPSSRLRSRAASVRFAEVTKTASPSATTALACRTPPGPSGSRDLEHDEPQRPTFVSCRLLFNILRGVPTGSSPGAAGASRLTAVGASATLSPVGSVGGRQGWS